MKRRKLATIYRAYLGKLLQLFLQGMVVLVPISITVYVVVSLFNFIDRILPDVINVVLPDLKERRMPGLGFAVVIVVILAAGWLSSLFIGRKLVGVIDRLLDKTPGIKFIYSSVRDFLQAFAGNKKKFDQPVLVNVDAADVWRIGFITQESAIRFNMERHVVVYVPHSYAISGITYIVPPERVKQLNGTSASDAMKFAVSGGVAHTGD